jgi:hypothetical protein
MDDTIKESKKRASLSRADVEISEEIASERSKLTRATVGKGIQGKAGFKKGQNQK